MTSIGLRHAPEGRHDEYGDVAVVQHVPIDVVVDQVGELALPPDEREREVDPDQLAVGPAQAVTVTALRPSTTVSGTRVTGSALNDFLISNDGC